MFLGGFFTLLKNLSRLRGCRFFTNTMSFDKRMASYFWRNGSQEASTDFS